MTHSNLSWKRQFIRNRQAIRWQRGHGALKKGVTALLPDRMRGAPAAAWPSNAPRAQVEAAAAAHRGGPGGSSH